MLGPMRGVGFIKMHKFRSFLLKKTLVGRIFLKKAPFGIFVFLSHFFENVFPPEGNWPGRTKLLRNLGS